MQSSTAGPRKRRLLPYAAKMRLLHIERITRKPNTKLFDRLSARFVVPDVILGGENRLKCKANAVAAWISIEVGHVTMSVHFLEPSQTTEEIAPLFVSTIEQKTESLQLLLLHLFFSFFRLNMLNMYTK